ncbi:MAG: HAD family hydrolase [Candidatus Saccharimonadales bacterium]
MAKDITIGSAVQTIIWDLDGTLIDSFEIFAEILAEVARLNVLDMPEREVLRHNFHGPLEDSIKHSLEISDPHLLKKIVADFLELQENYYALPDEHLLEDAYLLAQRLQLAGKRQIVVTNRVHASRGNASPRHIVEHSALRLYIDALVCGDESSFRKPDARVLNAVAANFDLERALVIGDQFVDAELAHNLGLQAVLIDRGGQGIAHLESLPDTTSYRVVRSLDEVLV